MDIQTISVAAAQEKISAGAILVDIRSYDEFVREHIDGAINVPLSQLQTQGLPVEVRGDAPVVFQCLSGMRTAQNCALLAQTAQGRETLILEGGLKAWKAGGLATVIDARQPLDLMRQVQISAGAMALAGAAGGWLVSPWLYVLCFLVGIGLLVAGITGFCGMARLLMHMPWNRVLRPVKSG